MNDNPPERNIEGLDRKAEECASWKPNRRNPSATCRSSRLDGQQELFPPEFTLSFPHFSSPPTFSTLFLCLPLGASLPFVPLLLIVCFSFFTWIFHFSPALPSLPHLHLHLSLTFLSAPCLYSLFSLFFCFTPFPPLFWFLSSATSSHFSLLLFSPSGLSLSSCFTFSPQTHLSIIDHCMHVCTHTHPPQTHTNTQQRSLAYLLLE